MLNAKKITPIVPTSLDVLSEAELLQLKGGTDTTTDGIVIEHIINQ